MTSRTSSRAKQELPAPSPADARIYRVRGHSVMLDSDLAEVYGVETKRINEAVKRNPTRFALPFSFQLTQKEWEL